MLAGLFIMVIGLFALSASLLLFWRSWRAHSYVPVSARIVERSVAGVTSASGPPRFAPKVRYTYRVDGRDYVGDRYAFHQRGYPMDTAKEKLAELPDAITVYVDPADPSEAVVERAGLGFAVLCGYLGVSLVLIALLVFAMS